MKYVTKDDLISIMQGISNKTPSGGGGDGGSNGLNVTSTVLLNETSNTVVQGATFTLPEDYTNYDEIILTTGDVASTVIKPSLSSTIGTTYYEASNDYAQMIDLALNGATATVSFAKWGTEYTVHPASVVLIGKKYNQSSGDAPDFIGATSQADGERGLVPKPLAGDEDKFLKADGTWASITNSGANVIVDTLWEGQAYTNNTDMVLSNNMYDYDALVICPAVYRDNGTNHWNDYVEAKIMLKQDDDFQSCSFSGIASTSANLSSKVTYSARLFVASNNILKIQRVTGFASSLTDNSIILARIQGIKLLNSNVYSTTEQRIGTWIDGKPVYQKTFTGTFGTITDNNTRLSEFHYDLSSLGIDKTVAIEGYYVNDDGEISSQFSTSGDSTTLDKRGVLYFCVLKNSSDNNKLYLETEIGSRYSGGNWVCTIKYTK